MNLSIGFGSWFWGVQQLPHLPEQGKMIDQNRTEQGLVVSPYGLGGIIQRQTSKEIDEQGEREKPIERRGGVKGQDAAPHSAQSQGGR